MKKPSKSDAHGKALKEAKLLKGLTKDQLRSRLRSLYSGWIRRMGL